VLPAGVWMLDVVLAHNGCGNCNIKLQIETTLLRVQTRLGTASRPELGWQGSITHKIRQSLDPDWNLPLEKGFKIEIHI